MAIQCFEMSVAFHQASSDMQHTQSIARTDYKRNAGNAANSEVHLVLFPKLLVQVRAHDLVPLDRRGGEVVLHIEKQ